MISGFDVIVLATIIVLACALVAVSFLVGLSVGRERGAAEAELEARREASRPRERMRRVPLDRPMAAGVFGALTAAGRSPAEVAAWMREPRLELGGRTPREAMQDGDVVEVLDLASDQPTTVLIEGAGT